jgi:mRNA interferase MazF
MDCYAYWNKLKQEIARKPPAFCIEREVWWCSIGMNIGTEIYGKNTLFERPVLVIKAYNLKSALVIPLSSTDRLGKYYFPIHHGEISGRLLLSQARMISTQRLTRKIALLPEDIFTEAVKAYKDSF